MIEIWKLTKRHLDNPQDCSKFIHISTFSKSLGHGVGTIDFSQKIAEFDDDLWDKICQNSDEYTKFKLGNIHKYFEIEIFPEHAEILIKNLPNSKFKDILLDLKEGYLTIRKVN